MTAREPSASRAAQARSRSSASGTPVDGEGAGRGGGGHAASLARTRRRRADRSSGTSKGDPPAQAMRRAWRGSGRGWSRRWWAPRLSARRPAAAAASRPTSSRLSVRGVGALGQRGQGARGARDALGVALHAAAGPHRRLQGRARVRAPAALGGRRRRGGRAPLGPVVGRAGERLGRAGRQHGRLQEPVRGEAVGAVGARGRALAHREQAGQGRAAGHVGQGAADGVVGRGGDGDGVAGQVEPVLGAEGRDGGEAGPHRLGVEVAQVEGDLAAQRGGAAGDRARDDVARAQLGHGVLARHEPVPAGVAQHRPLAPHRLAHQRERAVAEGERGGVELHQLEVGQRRAGPGGQGRAVGRRPGGVGGARVEPAHAARGERHRPRRARARPPVGAGRPEAGRAAVAHQHLDGALALGELDARVGPQRGRERGDDVGPGRVAAGVHDARRRVGALARQPQPSAAAVEGHPAGEQLGDLGRPLAADGGGGVGVAEAGPGRERVAQVRLDRVAAVHGRRDAALGAPRAAVPEGALGDDHDRPGLGGPEGQEGARDAAADHDHGLLRTRSRHVRVSLTVNRGRIDVATTRTAASGG